MAERGALRILVVDDDPAMVRLAAASLTAHGFTDLEHVDTGRDALLAAARADVLLLDQNLPDLAGREVLLALRAWPDPPSVVMVTAHGSETFAADALRAGADDYLVKDASLSAMLPEVVERVRRMRSLREALATAERELVHVERRAAVGEMTVTLHHEINNPLMAASAELELLLGAPEGLSAGQRKSLETIRGMLDRIRGIVKRAGELRRAATAEYAPGLRMIDLKEGARPEPASRGRALVLVPEEGTARVVESLLRRAGFTVQRVAGPSALVPAAQGFDVTLVLAAERSLPANLPGPTLRSYRLFILQDGDGTAARAAHPSQVLGLPLDPEGLAAALAEPAGPA
ncbi:MAG TPA: response regulator [Gemmatimonadales bacterium]|nr:response regulator [Gemmatimonadales bacterium]